MIYILAGTDRNKRRTRMQKILGTKTSVTVPSSDGLEHMLRAYAKSNSLFGELPVVITENILSEPNLSKETLQGMQDSDTLFIMLEDKLLAAVEKKYAKYATIERFDQKKIAAAPKVNTFAIADAFGRGDKISAWMLYREAVESGAEPEMISGMLFWKIKTMMLAGKNMKKQSSELISLYHRAHRGESDFIIGLEQFILSSLSK